MLSQLHLYSALGFEKPPTYTVYGGIIMIIALACNSILALREEWKNQHTTGAEPASPPLPPPTATTNGEGVHDIHGGKNFDMISP